MSLGGWDTGVTWGGAGQCHCEDGLQKVLDWTVEGLPVTGRKKVSHLASRRRMWGNYRLLSVTLALRKTVEQILLTAVLWLLQGRKVTRNSQNGSSRGKSCLTCLIVFCDGTGCVSRGTKRVLFILASVAFELMSQGGDGDRLWQGKVKLCVQNNFFTAGVATGTGSWGMSGNLLPPRCSKLEWPGPQAASSDLRVDSAFSGVVPSRL